jgi:putative restriction endonuclease
MKAVFDTRAGSAYDDDIVERYHFPNRYLDEAKKAVGDWIVYREPRRGGGRQAYMAVARLVRIDPDPTLPAHSYARLSNFLPFDRTVPLQHSAGFYEQQLNFVPAAQRGATLQGKSIRTISDGEFASIVVAGLDETLDPDNALRLQLDSDHVDAETLSLLSAPLEEKERRIATVLVNRKVREASFRRRVLAAYDDTCAITGLQLVNGGGKAEVQAAHIWSVADGGPDVERNGIALSSTVHWLFDRHLISLTDSHGLLVSHNRVPPELQVLFEKQLERIRLPRDGRLWPHVPYIQKHRAVYMAK